MIQCRPTVITHSSLHYARSSKASLHFLLVSHVRRTSNRALCVVLGALRLQQTFGPLQQYFFLSYPFSLLLSSLLPAYCTPLSFLDAAAGKLPFLRVFAPPQTVTTSVVEQPAVSTAFLGPLIMAAPASRTTATTVRKTSVVVNEKLFAGLQDIAAFYRSKGDGSAGAGSSSTGASAALAAAASAAGADLSPPEQASAQAFVSLVNGRLSSAALAELWCEPVSFESVARPTRYSRNYPFPLDWVLSWQTASTVQEQVLSSGRARTLNLVRCGRVVCDAVRCDVTRAVLLCVMRIAYRVPWVLRVALFGAARPCGCKTTHATCCVRVSVDCAHAAGGMRLCPAGCGERGTH